MDEVNFQKYNNENNDECTKVNINIENTGNACTTHDNDDTAKSDHEKVYIISPEKSIEVDEENVAILDHEERQMWEKIFKRLDQVDSGSNDGKISIEVVAKIVDRLEDRRSCFHIGPQTRKGVQRLENPELPKIIGNHFSEKNFTIN